MCSTELAQHCWQLWEVWGKEQPKSEPCMKLTFEISQNFLLDQAWDLSAYLLLFREKAGIWFTCGYNLFSRTSNIVFHFISFISMSILKHNSEKSFLLLCPSFLFNKNKQLKRDKIVISRTAFAVPIYNYLQNQAEHRTPYAEVSKMEQGGWSKEREKKNKGHLIFLLAQCREPHEHLPALHSCGFHLNPAATSRGIVAGAGLASSPWNTALKHRIWGQSGVQDGEPPSGDQTTPASRQTTCGRGWEQSPAVQPQTQCQVSHTASSSSPTSRDPLVPSHEDSKP